MERDEIIRLSTENGYREYSDYVRDTALGRIKKNISEEQKTDKKPIHISKKLINQLRQKWEEESRLETKPLDFKDFVSMILWLYASGFISDRMMKGLSPNELLSIRSVKTQDKNLSYAWPLEFYGEVEGESRGSNERG